MSSDARRRLFVINIVLLDDWVMGLCSDFGCKGKTVSWILQDEGEFFSLELENTLNFRFKTLFLSRWAIIPPKGLKSLRSQGNGEKQGVCDVRVSCGLQLV